MKSKPPPKKSAKIARPVAALPGQSSHPWWLHAVAILCLLLASLGLYQHTVGLGFLSVDDPDYIQNNPLLSNLTAANIKRILTEPYFANYAPANILSYAVDIALAGGKSPFAIHLSNVLWNGWAVCMVYLLAFTLRAEILTAAAASLSLPESAIAPSRTLLARQGNMSSATLGFLLQQLSREQATGHCVALGFGPGLMAEGLLLDFN